MSRARYLALFVLSLVATLGVTVPAAAAPGFHFAWPLPARALVSETTIKKGDQGTIRYEAVLAPDEKSKQLALRLQGFSFVEMAGMDLKDPANQEGMKQAVALASAIPTLLISREGKLVEIVGFDEMVERVVAAYPDEHNRKDVEQTLRSPQMRQMLKQKSTEFWKVWVGFWTDPHVPTAPGSAKITQQLPMPDGSMVTVPATITNRGIDKAGLVTLEMESVLEGEAARSSLARYLTKLGKEGGGKPFTPDMLERMRRVTHMRVLTDPKTLRPSLAWTEMTTTMKMKGEAELTQSERHEYRFTWK